MKKSKAIFKNFIKDDQFNLNQYLMYLFKQINLYSQNQVKECKTMNIRL
jgi:hypothetical protein